MRLATVSLVLALTASASAQIPDTNPPSAYFPLSVGDEWHYRTFDIGRDKVITRVVEAEVVVNDTTYARLRERRYGSVTGPPHDDRSDLLRVDATSGEIRRRTEEGDRLYPQVMCELNTPFPSPGGPSIECEFDDGFSRYVVAGAPASDGSRAFKHFSSIGGVDEVAAGIGLTHFRGDVTDGYDLEYARVRQPDGSAYEQGAPLVVADEDAPIPPTLAVTASPNPTAGALQLAIETPTAGALTVEAFDALGRRVYSDSRDAVSALNVDLDASEWAPGVYVVRVRSSAGVAMTRVVRR